jgi:hypothetical protein
MSYCTTYLNKAASTSDPFERLKLVAANWFSGICLSISLIGKMVPMNPILGETLQRVMSDGTTFLAEQTVHHPPIFNFELTGPDSNYIYRGHVENQGGIVGMNTIKGYRVTHEIIIFKDG